VASLGGALAILFLVPRTPYLRHYLSTDSKTITRSLFAVDPISLSGQPVAGVVPHHLLAGRQIADFFHSLTSLAPRVIVLIGPNHEGRGEKPILLSDYLWVTDFGSIAPSSSVLSKILALPSAAKDNPVVSSDQSITSLIPYSAVYLPQTRIIPVLLRRDTTLAECTSLAQTLASFPRLMLISSIDFSHYLGLKEASDRDLFTLELIKARDYQRILALSEEYLDSPPALVTALLYQEMVGEGTIQIAAHANSVQQSNPYEPSTSYYSLFFY